MIDRIDQNRLVLPTLTDGPASLATALQDPSPSDDLAELMPERHTAAESLGPARLLDLPAAPVMTDARRAEIDRFVGANVWAFEGGRGHREPIGGERIGHALVGNSELGELNAPERSHLATSAVEAWSRIRSHHNVNDATNIVRRDPDAAEAFSEALASTAAETDFEAHDNPPEFLTETGGTRVEQWIRAIKRRQHRQTLQFADHMRHRAFTLDAGTAAAAYKGREDVLGKELAQGSPYTQMHALEAVADGRISGDAADTLVGTMFTHADQYDLRIERNQAAFADALAMVANPDVGLAADAERELVADRLTGILGTEGGQSLLFGRTVPDTQRNWALAHVLDDPSWTAETTRNGWESDIVINQFARETEAEFASRGFAGIEISDDVLRSAIGRALDEPPVEEAATAGTDAAQADGADQAEEGQTARISDLLNQNAGAEAWISVVPIAVSSNRFGLEQHTLFRIDRADGKASFVNQNGTYYETLDDWQTENELPAGRMVAAAGLEPGAELIGPINTEAVVDTFDEYVGLSIDWSKSNLSLLNVAHRMIGMGSTSAMVSAGISGAYAGGLDDSDLEDEHERGVDGGDFTDPLLQGGSTPIDEQ